MTCIRDHTAYSGHADGFVSRSVLPTVSSSSVYEILGFSDEDALFAFCVTLLIESGKISLFKKAHCQRKQAEFL